MEQLRQVLRTGGEVFFTEMVASSRVREEVKMDAELWGKYLSGRDGASMGVVLM